MATKIQRSDIEQLNSIPYTHAFEIWDDEFRFYILESDLFNYVNSISFRAVNPLLRMFFSERDVETLNKIGISDEGIAKVFDPSFSPDNSVDIELREGGELTCVSIPFEVVDSARWP